MKEVSLLTTVNLTLYKNFFDIYIGLKDMMKPINYDQIKVQMKLYNQFRYERISTKARGLPPIDDFYEPNLTEDAELDSSDLS